MFDLFTRRQRYFRIRDPSGTTYIDSQNTLVWRKALLVDRMLYYFEGHRSEQNVPAVLLYKVSGDEIVDVIEMPWLCQTERDIEPTFIVSPDRLLVVVSGQDVLVQPLLDLGKNSAPLQLNEWREKPAVAIDASGSQLVVYGGTNIDN